LVVIVGNTLIAAIYGIPEPILFKIAEEYGPWTAQIMSILASLGIIVGGPVTGFLFRRWGTRAVLISCLATYCVSGSLAVKFGGAVSLLASRFVLGMSAAGTASASVAIVSATFGGNVRNRLLGIQSGLATIAGIAFLWLSGESARDGNWRRPFALYAYAAIPLLFAILGFRKQTDLLRATGAVGGGQFLEIRRIWDLFLLVIVLYAASFSAALQLSFKMGEHGIVDPRTQSYVIMLGSLCSALGAAAYGFVGALLAESTVFVCSIALLAAGALTIGFVAHAVWIAVGAALMGLGGGLMGPCLTVRVLARVSGGNSAAAIGLLYSGVFLGAFLNPLIMQPLRAAFTSDGAFIAVGGAFSAGVAWICAMKVGKSLKNKYRCADL
jgi:MFS family permease